LCRFHEGIHDGSGGWRVCFDLVFSVVSFLASRMSRALSDEQIKTLEASIFQGRKIEAIKLCRELTGLGLKEAKDTVEELDRSLRAASPEKFAASPQGKGCVGVLVVGLLCSGLVTYWLACA
jgi:Ribosomal protein L7/L12 C-terminal domain